MKAKLIIEGREFPIEIQDPELQKLLMPKKKTGYERVERNEEYYYIDCYGDVGFIPENHLCGDNDSYEKANYYSDGTIAENNARADKLMRQLRRFAVEHRSVSITWTRDTDKYIIYYDHNEKILDVGYDDTFQYFCGIYFDSQETANKAIETFRDELIWYFTEYKDSL